MAEPHYWLGPQNLYIYIYIYVCVCVLYKPVNVWLKKNENHPLPHPQKKKKKNQQLSNSIRKKFWQFPLQEKRKKKKKLSPSKRNFFKKTFYHFLLTVPFLVFIFIRTRIIQYIFFSLTFCFFYLFIYTMIVGVGKFKS